MRKLLVAFAVCGLVLAATSLQASLIPVATTSGVVAVHYDADNPSNASYYRLQFSSTNTNRRRPELSARFQVDFWRRRAIWTGCDLYRAHERRPGSNAYGRRLQRRRACSKRGVHRLGHQRLRTEHTGRPGNPTNIPYNSLFRGPSIDFFASTLTHVGPVYTLTVSGQLVSDGNINWYYPAAGTTSLASVGLDNVFPFTATYTDNINTDPGLNFFSGTATIFAETPEPAACVLLSTGLAGLIGFAYWRKRAARGQCTAS